MINEMTAMKKSILHLLSAVAVCALSLSSCTKEVEKPSEQLPIDTEQAKETFQIIGTIKDGELTKTEYVEDSGTYRFSWSTDPATDHYDEIGLLVKNSTSSVDWYRLFADNATSSTTFSTYQYIGDVTNGQAWSQTGFAIYPVAFNTNGGKTGIDRKDKLSFEKSLNEGNVIITLSSSYNLGADPDMNTQLSCTPLVGNRVGSTNEYEFRTAVGVLMITLENVHTNVTALRLTSPSSSAPLSGQFSLESGKPDIAMANHTSSAASDQSRTINFSVSTADTKTFYIPLPVGTIPLVGGKGLQIELLAGEETIFSRRYTKELTIVKNQIIPVTLDSEWKKLGTGKFIDNHLWGKMGFGTNTFEEVGAVDVVIYQNNYDRTQYRIANPYGQAASYLAAESKSQGEHDDYLSFTVPSEGNVTFTDHRTGYTVSGENVTIKHVSSEHNKLVAGTSAAPAIVQLAPQYKGAGSYQDDRYSYDNKVQIVFPSAVDSYGGSLSINSNMADLSSGISWSKGGDATVYVAILSDVPIFQFFTNDGDTKISNVPSSRKSNPNSGTIAASALGYDANKQYGSYSDQTKSGIKYLTWSTWSNNNGDRLYQVGCKKFYGIIPSHVTTYIGDYTMYYGNASADPISVKSIPMTFEVSDDPTKGNIKLTNFAGISGELYGLYETKSNNNLQFLGSRTTPFASNVYIYSNNDQDQSNLNFALGFETAGATYGSRNWNTISWNHTIKLNQNGSATSYQYMRGDKMPAVDKIDLTGKISVNVECMEKDGSKRYETNTPATTALIDGNKATYWHTSWKSASDLSGYTDPYTTDDLDKTYGAYIDIDLGVGNEITNFKTRLGFRSGADNNHPKHMKIYASDDGSTWGNPIAEVTNLTIGKNLKGGDWTEFVWCPIGSAKRYIRVSIVENSNGHSLTNPDSYTRCLNVSELEIYGQ